MPFPFDATLKDIVQDHAPEFSPAFGLPRDGPVAALNVDLSTLSAATDVALGYGEPLREVVDLNFQSGADPEVPWRAHLYNAAFGHRLHVPVSSILVLLRQAADHPNLTGKVHYGRGATRVQFNYKVIRLWQRPVKPFLVGGLGLLPLAPLCALPPGQSLEAALADLIRQIDRRLRAEADEAEAKRLLTGAFILTGLRVSYETAGVLFRGVAGMQESSTYQHILEEGRQEGRVRQAQKYILRLARQRFGAPRKGIEPAVVAITNLERLDRMIDRVLQAADWNDLLSTS